MDINETKDGVITFFYLAVEKVNVKGSNTWWIHYMSLKDPGRNFSLQITLGQFKILTEKGVPVLQKIISK